MASTAVLASRAEYDARTEAGERLEFDDGQIIEMPNNDSLHDGIKETLFRELIRRLPRPIVAANEHTFEIAPDRIRYPNVALCLERRPRIARKKFQGAPALHAKIQLYLENGAKAVWIVLPDSRQIDIHQRDLPTRHLDDTCVIEGEEPVPAFRLAVADLFE